MIESCFASQITDVKAALTEIATDEIATDEIATDERGNVFNTCFQVT